MGGYILISKWTIFQLLTTSFLLFFAFTLTYFREGFSDLIVNNETMSLLMYTSFFMVTVASISLLFYFQTKKSSTFLIHPLWKKMHVIIGIIILISMITVIILSISSPMLEIIQNRPLLLFILGYYFLYIFNLFVLSIIHRFGDSNINPTKEVERAFWGTLLLLLLIIFLAPRL